MLSSSERLTGTGTAPYVDLSWIASTSEVSGYNVYRSTSAKGTYTKLNSTLDVDTSYADKTVAGGMTYYYKTTAVSSSGKESPYSGDVEVEIPSECRLGIFAFLKRTPAPMWLEWLKV